MITTDFTGNFGNHIFQYVTLRSVAERKGYEWGCTNYIYGDYFGGISQMDFLDLDYGKPVVGIERDYQEVIVNLGHTNVHQYHDFEDLKDNSKLVGCWQTEQYFDKEKVREWVKIKNIEGYRNMDTDDDECIINVRGGEYKGIASVLLPKSYWDNAIAHMKDINPRMKFTVITDDVPYARTLFPEFPLKCYHTGINTDYYMIYQAKYLILSNSSFAWFPAWLNPNVNTTIAPKYWARYNISDGYWGSSNIFTKGWLYLNREGELETYEDVVEELRNSRYSHLYNLED